MAASLCVDDADDGADGEVGTGDVSAGMGCEVGTGDDVDTRAGCEVGTAPAVGASGTGAGAGSTPSSDNTIGVSFAPASRSVRDAYP